MNSKDENAHVPDSLLDLNRALALFASYQDRAAKGIAERPEEFLEEHPDLAAYLAPLLDEWTDSSDGGDGDEPLQMGLLPPSRIGPYLIESFLGSGGQAEVWLGRRPAGPDAAIKIFFAPPGSDPRRLKQLEREAVAASRLKHPSPLREPGERALERPLLDRLRLRGRGRTGGGSRPAFLPSADGRSVPSLGPGGRADG